MVSKVLSSADTGTTDVEPNAKRQTTLDTFYGQTPEKKKDKRFKLEFKRNWRRIKKKQRYTKHKQEPTGKQTTSQRPDDRISHL